MVRATSIDWSDYAAVLFDLDGVLTPTAIVHRAAWKQTFDRVLAEHDDPKPFEDEDYLRYVDGRPRYDGVRTFLEARSIHLADGEPEDAPGFGSVCAVGNLKNEMFNEVLRDDGVEPYAGSVRLLDRLEELDVAVAVVSSSANAPAVLDAAGLRGRFGVVVDGLVARQESLEGKPAPATYLRASELLGVSHRDAVVVEDAESGVEAGRRGDFGLVVGVDREGHADRLSAAGADLVVDDLGRLV